jgi:hypothetical protein
MEFSNTAVVYEEVLLDIVSVLEWGWPAGPYFLHSLGSLVEALVIHEHVFLDPANYHTRTDLRAGNVTSTLFGSDFCQQLLKAKALETFPAHSLVDKQLKGFGRDYEMLNFVMDSTWSLATFSLAEPGREQSNLETLRDLSEVPEVFSGDYLIDTSLSTLGFVQLESPALLGALVKYGFSAADLKHVDGLNHRAKAFLDLSRNLGMNIYPPFAALPHQFGAVRASNTKARRVYEDLAGRIEARLVAAEDHPVGGDSYSRVPVAPLTQIVLASAKDSPRAFAEEICELRQKHREFRGYLTDFERAWTSAVTKQERIRLTNEMENAWKSLVERIERPSTRIVYQLWDILKKPTEILAAFGDKLTESGRKRYVMDRVAGLYDFWRELANGPVTQQNQLLLGRLFKCVADAPTWAFASQVAEKFNVTMTAGHSRLSL